MLTDADAATTGMHSDESIASGIGGDMSMPASGSGAAVPVAGALGAAGAGGATGAGAGATGAGAGAGSADPTSSRAGVGGVACSASPETCDGVDNDCDGKTDEELGCVCVPGQIENCAGEMTGPCEPGTRSCDGGKWGQCVGRVMPAPEICDGQDNDCNGNVDDGKLCAVGMRCEQARCVQCVADNDCLAQAAVCKAAYCESGSCKLGNSPYRQPCSTSNYTGVCNNGSCFNGCLADGDCTGSQERCINNRCSVPPACGNGRLDSGENCEPGNIPATCASLGFDSGRLYCNSQSCRFDTSMCVTAPPPNTGGSGG